MSWPPQYNTHRINIPSLAGGMSKKTCEIIKFYVIIEDTYVLFSELTNGHLVSLHAGLNVTQIINGQVICASGERPTVRDEGAKQRCLRCN